MKIADSLFSLSNKTIIITGASSGIGSYCTIAADRMGANLYLFGRDKNRLQETLYKTQQPDNHKIIAIDLTHFEQIENLFSKFRKEKIKFHGLINCAGISTTLPLKRTTPDKIHYFVETNVSTAIKLSQLATQKYFIDESGASIIFITSIMGVVGEVGKTLYSITKGALIAASKSMALELAQKKIRVNCVSPGVIETPMSGNAIYNRDIESRKIIESLHPLGFGKPEDVANACVYLLSDAASWVTGINLVVDGGYTAR